jgi:16S rRNA (adenine1518-N6/adenine1519-N6)-dimethyltransferase
MQARAGTKDYSGYTVKLGLLARPDGHFEVARTSFLPPPRVDSTVISLQRRFLVDGDQQYQRTKRIIDRAFAMRRKTLRNNLQAYFDADRVDEALARAGIDGKTRAETLDIQMFITLANALEHT